MSKQYSERPCVSYALMVSLATELLTEDDSNPEYDRALFELIARSFPVVGMPTGERAVQIEQDVRAQA